MNRRQFITTGSLSALSSLLFNSDSSTAISHITSLVSQGAFVQIVRCDYPEHETFESFTEKSKMWTKPDFIPLLDLKYAQLGQLLHKKFREGHGYAEWSYYFIDISSFEAWSKDAQEYGIFNSLKIPQEFKYTFKYIQISHNTNITSVANSPLFTDTLIGRRDSLV